MKFTLGFVSMWAAVLAAAIVMNATIAGCSTTDVATPDEAAMSQSLQQQRAAAVANGDEAEVARISALIAQHDTNIAERAVGGIIDSIDPWVPAPLQPFKEVLAGVGALALFKRPRKHLINGAKAVGKLDLKEAGTDVLRAVGLMHSSVASAEAADRNDAT